MKDIDTNTFKIINRKNIIFISVTCALTLPSMGCGDEEVKEAFEKTANSVIQNAANEVLSKQPLDMPSSSNGQYPNRKQNESDGGDEENADPKHSDPNAHQQSSHQCPHCGNHLSLRYTSTGHAAQRPIVLVKSQRKILRQGAAENAKTPGEESQELTLDGPANERNALEGLNAVLYMSNLEYDYASRQGFGVSGKISEEGEFSFLEEGDHDKYSLAKKDGDIPQEGRELCNGDDKYTPQAIDKEALRNAVNTVDLSKLLLDDEDDDDKEDPRPTTSSSNTSIESVRTETPRKKVGEKPNTEKEKRPTRDELMSIEENVLADDCDAPSSRDGIREKGNADAGGRENENSDSPHALKVLKKTPSRSSGSDMPNPQGKKSDAEVISNVRRKKLDRAPSNDSVPPYISDNEDDVFYAKNWGY